MLIDQVSETGVTAVGHSAPLSGTQGLFGKLLRDQIPGKKPSSQPANLDKSQTADRCASPDQVRGGELSGPHIQTTAGIANPEPLTDSSRVSPAQVATAQRARVEERPGSVVGNAGNSATSEPKSPARIEMPVVFDAEGRGGVVSGSAAHAAKTTGSPDVIWTRRPGTRNSNAGSVDGNSIRPVEASANTTAGAGGITRGSEVSGSAERMSIVDFDAQPLVAEGGSAVLPQGGGWSPVADPEGTTNTNSENGPPLPSLAVGSSGPAASRKAASIGLRSDRDTKGRPRLEGPADLSANLTQPCLARKPVQSRATASSKEAESTDVLPSHTNPVRPQEFADALTDVIPNPGSRPGMAPDIGPRQDGPAPSGTRAPNVSVNRRASLAAVDPSPKNDAASSPEETLPAFRSGEDGQQPSSSREAGSAGMQAKTHTVRADAAIDESLGYHVSSALPSGQTSVEGGQQPTSSGAAGSAGIQAKTLAVRADAVIDKSLGYQVSAALPSGQTGAEPSTRKFPQKPGKAEDGVQQVPFLKAGATVQTEKPASLADAALGKSPSNSGEHQGVPVSLSPAARSTGSDLSSPYPVSGPQQWHVAPGIATEQQSLPGAHLTHLPAGGPFERMDSASAAQTIDSSPQWLAVGVHSERLGWVEIRTNSAAGQIAATLASGPGEPHNTISAQLPSVREYLAGEHVHVDTLSSERFSQSPGRGSDSSGGQPQNDGARYTKAAETGDSPRGSPVEMDMQGLSYIDVRV